MSDPFDDLPPDPVIEYYKTDFDMTLIPENLNRAPQERVCNLVELQRFAEEPRRAGREVWSRK